MDRPVTIIGGGLAGCEAAYQLLRRGVPVRLYEMRPGRTTPAHKGGGLAELVCSNSLRAASVENAVGLLKEEMRRLGSLIMEAADATAVPAGGALAVDRHRFSAYIEERLAACRAKSYLSNVTSLDFLQRFDGNLLQRIGFNICKNLFFNSFYLSWHKKYFLQKYTFFQPFFVLPLQSF